MARAFVLAVLFGGTVVAWSGPTQDVGNRSVPGVEPVDDLFAEGLLLYGTTCIPCHDAAGGDGLGAALSGHPSMGARDHIVRQILGGNPAKGMPAFATMLDNRQVAAIGTYIRNAWDNRYGVVRPEDVQRLRDESQTRSAR